ncbi:MAG: arginase [Rhodobacterales bacterium]|nr:arginase [Rhodobacterales bacterium]
MISQNCILIGAPIDSGKRRQGCLMGPDSLRTAGLERAITGLGYQVRDLGNLAPAPIIDFPHAPHIYQGNQTVAWTKSIHAAAISAMELGTPIFLGGDHALSLGSLTGVAAHAAAQNRAQFVLWLDAHSDFHTPQSTDSGNLHGTPLAYASGASGFDGFPEVKTPIARENICIIGLRSVDLAERQTLQSSPIHTTDMRAIDDNGIAQPLAKFLTRVAKAGGALHVSLDVDFLDPSVAPAVGTTVPGGITVREAHQVMEMLHESALMTSLDLVELNPFLDERGRTAQLMVDLAASGFGRRVFDRPTRAFS